MKILLIDVNYKNSSTGKLVFDLKNGIRNKGHEAYVAYGRGKGTKDKNVFKFGFTIETYIDALLTRITGFVGYFSFFSTYNLINYIKKIKPEIIHIHEIHSYFINIPIFLNFLSQNPSIKIFWTFHSEFMYTGKCGNSLSCEKWKTGCEKCPLLREYPKTWFFDFTKKMYFDKKNLVNKLNNITIVTPSIWLKKRTSISMFSKFKIKTIHNGIDTKNTFHHYDYDKQFFERFQLPKKYVLAVAPNIMEKNKGGKIVIEIARKLPDITFVMIGFKKIPKDLPANIIPFVKTSDQLTLAKFYSFASLFLITSQIENFPTTCLEALCCGTKIIGFNVGGVSETTKNTEFGFFYKYDDIVSLIKNINENIYISYDKKEVSKFGIKNYDLEVCLNEYLNLYNE